MKLCEKDNCSACSACVNICPKNAISYKKNDLGFCYPTIDDKLCVNCGLCEKKCHIKNDIKKEYPKKAYAVWSSDNEDRKTSTSGGAASVFYQHILANKGVCYGATYDENLNVVIKGYDDANVRQFKNSKYVHSEMGDSYKTIKQNLDDNKQVIFIGLPCQVAALKVYLDKNYKNLVLVDIICHGTPPQEYLTSHIKNLEKKHRKKANYVSFRLDNEFYFTLKSLEKNKPFVSIHKDIDTYLLSFFEALTYQDACYNCKYACNERVSDITIGDFWGLGVEEPFDHPYSGAISLVLTNTEKGMDFFNEVKAKCFYEERKVEEALKGNAQLNYPSVPDSKRKEFFDLYKKEGFEKAVELVYFDRIKEQRPIVKKYELKKKIRIYAKKILRR